LDDVLTQVAREAQRRYYGKYRGFVSDNADPDQLGRIRVTVPSVLADTVTDWALPVLPFTGAQDIGQLMLPEVGAAVWVEFEEGDVSHPLWVGAFWTPPTQPSSGSGQAKLGDPAVRGLHTSAGHVLLFDDTSGSESFHLEHPAGTTVDVDSNGTITLTDASGGQVEMDANASKLTIADANGNSAVLDGQGITIADANGNQIEMAAAGVTLTGQQLTLDASVVQIGSAASEPVIKGLTFLTAYLAHIHPTFVGPSGPPIPTTEMASVSTEVMTG
jgi:uncharacterized protein involved in type VI secretion and phage assembly